MSRERLTIEQAIELTHDAIHAVENDPEEQLFVSMGRREVYLASLGLFLIIDEFSCAAKPMALALLNRLGELVGVQTDWATQADEEGDDCGDE